MHIKKEKIMNKPRKALNPLFGAKDTVACIAEAGDDVPLCIQALIESGTVNIHIRMCSMHKGNAFWRGKNMHQFNAKDTALFE